MGIVKKHGITNTLISYIGVLIGFLNTSVLLTNFLSADQVGLTRIITHLAMIMAQLSALGTSNIVLRYFPFFKTENNKHNGFLSVVLFISLIGFLLVSLFMLVFKSNFLFYYQNKSDLFIEYFFLVFPITFSLILFNIFSVYSNALFRSIVPTIINDFILRILVTLSISLFVLNIISFSSFMYFFAIAYSTTGLFLMIYLFYKKEAFLFSRISINFKKIKELIIYGLISLITGFTNMITLTIDSLMIGAMLGLGGVGIYSIAIYFVSLIMIPVRSIYKVANPLVANYWNNNDLKSIDVLYKKTSLNNLIIVLFLFINIWVNIEDIYLIMPSDYSKGIYAFLFLAIGRMLDASMSINRIIIRTSTYFRFETFFTILFAIMVVFFNYIFITHFQSIDGAAIGTMLSIIIFNIICTLFVKIKFNIHPFSFGYLNAIGIAVLSVFLTNIIPETRWWLNICIRSLFISVFFVGVVCKTKISLDFNQLVIKNMKKSLSVFNR